MFSYSKADFTVLLPPKGNDFIEIRGQASTRAAYLRLLTRLTQVSTGDWLAAMPLSVATPARKPLIAERMLAGVPVPSGFDRSTVLTFGSSEGHDFTISIVNTVSCAG